VKIFKKFRQLCGRAGLLPASHVIPSSFIKTTEHPVAFGAFGDVWEGIHDGKRVAIKALRIYKRDDVRKVAKVGLGLVISAGGSSRPSQGILQGGGYMEEDLPSQYCPLPGCFRSTCTP
jgi:hypothetical protein